MKKVTYNNKTQDELKAELSKLKSVVRTAIAKTSMGKNNKEYTLARKNIARVLTAINNPASTTNGINSTEVKK